MQRWPPEQRLKREPPLWCWESLALAGEKDQQDRSTIFSRSAFLVVTFLVKGPVSS